MLFKMHVYAQNEAKQQLEITYFKRNESLKKVESVRTFDSKNRPIYTVYYYENGQLNSIATWLNGNEIGNWFIFYDNGQLQESLSYNVQNAMLELPLKHSVDTNFVEYSATKTFISFNMFSYKNPRMGTQTTYYLNGKTESICTYKTYICNNKNNKEIKIGTWKFFNIDGNLQYERTYGENGNFISDKFYW